MGAAIILGVWVLLVWLWSRFGRPTPYDWHRDGL